MCGNHLCGTMIYRLVFYPSFCQILFLRVRMRHVHTGETLLNYWMVSVPPPNGTGGAKIVRTRACAATKRLPSEQENKI